MLKIASVDPALRRPRPCARPSTRAARRRPGCRWDWAFRGPARSGASRRGRAVARFATQPDRRCRCVCITRRITVRRDQPNGQSRRRDEADGGASAPSQSSGRLSFVALPGQEREQVAHGVAAVPVGDDLDVRVGVRIDARADRHRLGEVPARRRGGDRLDRLACSCARAWPDADRRAAAASRGALHSASSLLVPSAPAAITTPRAVSVAAPPAQPGAGALARHLVAVGAVLGARAVGRR